MCVCIYAHPTGIVLKHLHISLELVGNPNKKNYMNNNNVTKTDIKLKRARVKSWKSDRLRAQKYTHSAKQKKIIFPLEAQFNTNEIQRENEVEKNQLTTIAVAVHKRFRMFFFSLKFEGRKTTT